MSEDRFVSAYDKTTGEKQRIPRHWLDHPVLGAKFSLTPKASAMERQRDSARSAPQESGPTPTSPGTPPTPGEEPVLDSTTNPSDTDPAAEPKE